MRGKSWGEDRDAQDSRLCLRTSKGMWILLISLNEEVTVSSSPFTVNLLVAGTKYRKETAQGDEFHFGS